MNLLGWTLGKAEGRQLDYTQAIAQAFQSLAGQAAPPRADSLAVIEACTELIAAPLLVATVVGLPLPPRMPYQAARDLLRLGSSVWAIDTVQGVLSLHRASKWDIRGSSPDPASWLYDLETNVPDGTIKATYSAAQVVHLRLASNPGTDWIGQAPWQAASISAEALAAIEMGIRDEGRIINGRIWTMPDGGSQGQAQAMASTLRSMIGGASVIAETTAGGYGQGKLAAPKSDWTPVHSGQAHSAGNVAMKDSAEASIAAAYGVPSAFLNADATAPAIREVKRMCYLNKTLPLTALMLVELRDKIDVGLDITWRDLASQSVDVHLRSMAVPPLVELGANKEELLRLVGLPLTVEAQAQASGE